MIFKQFQTQKIIIILVLICLSQSVCLSLSKYDKEAARLKDAISKLRKEVARLKASSLTISSRARIAKITDLVEGHEARVEKLLEQLAAVERAKVKEAQKKEQTKIKETKEIPQLVEEVSVEVGEVGYQEETVPATIEVFVEPAPSFERMEESARPTPRLQFEIGGLVGIYGACTAAIGEIRFPLRNIFGPATTSFRLAGGLAQSEDMSRRYATIQADGILNFPAGWFT
ncbi:MAG: hypothetical protein KJ732_04095, partial [Candidatus Margulisbacteria bacterium]|nr:hypothetical protein [Candidatus Margulisiibacteriota bacterium]